MGDLRTMDETQYRAKLSEVADWRTLDPNEVNKTSGIPRKYSRKKPKPQVDEEVDEQEEQEDAVQVNDQHLPVVLNNLKVKGCHCEDCGKYCESGRKKEIQFYWRNGKTFLREKCNTCRKQKNPYTGEFDLGPIQAAAVWHAHIKAKKEHAPKSKTYVEDGREVQQDENEVEIIKRYRDISPQG